VAGLKLKPLREVSNHSFLSHGRGAQGQRSFSLSRNSTPSLSSSLLMVASAFGQNPEERFTAMNPEQRRAFRDRGDGEGCRTSR